MTGFIEGECRTQATLFPERLDDYIPESSPVRVIDVFVDELDLGSLHFKTVAEVTGRPPYLQGLVKFARTYMKLLANMEAVRDARTMLKDERVAGKPKERNRRPTDDELNQLRDYWTSPKVARLSSVPMWTLTEFAINTAMRMGEITRIHWEDLNRKHKTVIIRDRKHPTDKQGNDQEVPLLPGAYALIPKRACGELIFPYYPQSISTAFTRTCLRLGIKELRFHDLRHEGTSRLFEAGYQIQEVAIFTGHRDCGMLRRYTNLKAMDLHRHG